MPAYVIVHVTVNDAAAYAQYRAASSASISAHGGVVLAADDRPVSLEGEWPGPRTVVVRFDSTDAARQWYDSPEYGDPRGIRQACTSSSMAIVGGLR